MPHEFDTQTQNTAPRMTDDEARTVVALWQSEQMGSPERDRPTPADIAEGLDISTADAVRLLTQVRAERTAARETRLAAQQEELARAERDARLAEQRARQAEAEARTANSHLQVPGTSGYHYVRRRKLTPGKAIFLVVWFIFLQWLVSTINHLHTTQVLQPTCSMNNKPVPCSEIDVPNK